MVTVRKWGGVSLGRTAPTKMARGYKTNERYVLTRKKAKRRKAEERKARGKAEAKESGAKESQGGRREQEVSLRSEQEVGVSAQKRIRKRACGARVGV